VAEPQGVRHAAPDVSTQCESMRDHVESYALGALDESERLSFEAHAADCPRCRAALADAERAVAVLPFALAQAAPQPLPPSLRARVMRLVAEPVAQQAAELVARPVAPAAPPTWLPSPAREIQPTSRTWPTWLARPGWPTWRSVGAIVAAAVVALSFAWSAQLGVALARERALRAELAQELAAVSGQREIVLEVVDARDKTTRMLRPAAGAPREFATSYGKLYTRPDMPYVVAMTGRMPTPPPGQAYHLWVRLDGQTRLAGVLDINTDGFAQLVFQADRNGPAYESASLTLQPLALVGQTPAAPGTPLLRWDPN
jgi:hypothetical protein